MAQINGALTLSAVGSAAPMPTRSARGRKASGKANGKASTRQAASRVQQPAKRPNTARKASGAKASTKPLTSAAIALGDGITASWQGDNLVLVIPCDVKTIANAPMTSSGRTKLVATTRGWQSLERPSDGKRVSVQLGAVAKPE